MVNFHTKKSLEIQLESNTQSLILTTDQEKYDFCCAKCKLLSISMKRHHVDSLLLVN